jgi:hypothetical protein
MAAWIALFPVFGDRLINLYFSKMSEQYIGIIEWDLVNSDWFHLFSKMSEQHAGIIKTVIYQIKTIC